jgi:hypothetical protein
MAVSTAQREGSPLVTHALYAQFAPSWAVARDLYEGTGGFLHPDRPYLIPHPREWNDHSTVDATSGATIPNPNPRDPSPKLLMRRKLARYENIAAAILDAVSGALFLQAPSRSFGAKTENEAITKFWGDCDGKGTDLSTFSRESFMAAGVFGHVHHLMEKPDGMPETAADQGSPYVCRYTPLDVLDWLDDGEGRLMAVKLAEVAPRDTFGQKENDLKRIRVRIVDETKWKLYDHKGILLKEDAHGFGELPVDVLYARKRLLTPFVGKSVMGDPQLYIDLYNLISEVRELLRNQTFAVLNVPLGKDNSAESEMQKLGKQSGTSNVLFSTEPANFISPEGTNVEAYHEHMERLTRMIYRLATAPWEGDSRDAESADSRKIKRSEYGQILKTYALELQRSERRMTWLAYRALYGESAQAKWEADQPNITYATDFAPVELDVVVKNAADALGLDLGETVQRELKKKVARAVLPDMTKDLQAQVDGELDTQEYLSKADEREQEIDQAAAKFAGAA